MANFRYKKPTLWKGEYISIRDYVVQNCLKKGENMIVWWGHKRMTLTPKELKSPESTGITNTSKFQPNQKYKLLDYKWKEDKEQQELFSN